MKSIIVLSLAAVATLAVPKLSLREQWAGFKATHNKVYSNAVEEVRRMAIFQSNVAKIEAHNALYEKGEVTFSKGINQFGDWTKEEFMEYVNRGKLTRPQSNETMVRAAPAAKKATATSVDWRGTAVTEVKSQGSCGSCWSFSATGAIEGALAINGGRLVSLSEQNLMDCSRDYGTASCNGGWMASGFLYVQDNGIMSESDYPYEAKDDSCRFDQSKSVTSLSGYYQLPVKDEAADYAAQYGPIAAAVDVTDEIQFYNGGVFYDSTCSQDTLNHGILVVGYGSDGGDDYWIVKNSWGEAWGDHGYYFTARNRGNDCGIATAGELPYL